MNENESYDNVVDPMTVGPDTFVTDNEALDSDWISRSIAVGVQAADRMISITKAPTTPTNGQLHFEHGELSRYNNGVWEIITIDLEGVLRVISTRKAIDLFVTDIEETEIKPIELKSPEERMIKQRVIPISVNGIKNEQSTIKR